MSHSLHTKDNVQQLIIRMSHSLHTKDNVQQLIIRMSHSLHIKDNVQQLIISNILFCVVVGARSVFPVAN